MSCSLCLQDCTPRLLISHLLLQTIYKSLQPQTFPNGAELYKSIGFHEGETQ
jgi:hypothetical protein